MFDLEGLGAVAGKAAIEDVSVWSDDELCRASLALIDARRRLDAAECHVVAELEARGTCEIEFGDPTHVWWATQAGLPRGVAKARVKTATAMRTTLDETDRRLGEGRISFEQARVMADVCNPRIAAGIAAVQDHLLDLGVGVRFEQWAREVARFAALLDQDGGYDPEGDVTRNRLKIRHHPQGAQVTGSLTGEHAATVDAALEARADELFRQYSRDHETCAEVEVPPRATLLALALVDLCRRGLACDLDSTRPPRPEVVLVIEADDDESVSTASGVRLADGTVRALRCDADVQALIVDSLGVPLDMGRTVRLATPAQRTALLVRDGGCIWPGCDAPFPWVDVHHMPPWDHGGHTDVGSMGGACRRHHGVLHRNGWSCGIDPDGWVWIRTPNGHAFWGQRHGRPRPHPPPIPDG